MTIYLGTKETQVVLPPMLDLLNTQVEDSQLMFDEQRLCLFSDPGTGKTLTAIATYDKAMAKVGQKLVVVVPSIAVRNWYTWLEVYFEGKLVIQTITTQQQSVRPDADVLILTYGMLSRKGAKSLHTLLDFNPQTIILDESDNLNGYKANRTRVIYGGPGHVGLTSKVPYVWPLTGTPVRRYADDLFPVLNSLYPEVLKQVNVHRYDKFVDEFCVQKPMQFAHARWPVKVVVSSKNMDKLNAMLYGGEHKGVEYPQLAIRRRLSDVAEFLPPMTERIIDVPFKPSSALKIATDEAMSADMVMDDYGNVIEARNPMMAAAMNLFGQEKAPIVAEYVASTLQGMRANGDTSGVVVFFWHKKVGLALAAALTEKGFRSSTISGATPDKDRQAFEDAFNAGKLPIILGQIKTMGVSLNLQQNCHWTVFAERDWSAAAQQQAFQRVWRMGQKEHVQVDYCIADWPLEDPKSSVLGRKETQSAKIVERD